MAELFDGVELEIDEALNDGVCEYCGTTLDFEPTSDLDKSVYEAECCETKYVLYARIVTVRQEG